MSRRACYPRPDFRRETWMSLNGAWRFSFGDEEKDRRDQPPTLSQMPLTIEVPYVYQCELSGIGQTESHDVVWYGKTFRLPDCFDGMYSIDFLPLPDGRLIFDEVEEMVGCRMLYQYTEHDIVKDYVTYLFGKW